jgi:RimJ/RimL family protein N-acetyltransferase
LLKGLKVVLREKRVDDAAEDYAWRCDEELARLDATTPLRLSFSEFLADYAEELHNPSRRRRRFAIDTLEGKHIGNLMYYDIEEDKGEAELGVMIGDRDYWNQGYGADAINTLLEYVFSATSLKRVYLNTLDWNIQAQRCFEKCGFVPCRRVKRYNGTFIAMEMYRDSWQGITNQALSRRDAIGDSA